MNRLFFSSHNAGKIKELTTLFKERNMQIVTDPNLPAIAETGSTFVENALIKAKAGCQFSTIHTIAEDSGLCIPAIENEPGLYSARYAGKEATSTENIQALLKKLSPLPKPISAFFYCCLVYIHHSNDPLPIICEGKLHGSIISQPRGAGGFGYDPIFWSNTHQSTLAELPIATKNRISARSVACRRMLQALEQRTQNN